MSEPNDIKVSDVHAEKGITQVEDSHNLESDAKLESYKAAAMEAEMAEQKSGVIQAVREYPMAALWAFIMSCTIVRYSFLPLTLTIALMCIIDYGVLLRVPHG